MTEAMSLKYLLFHVICFACLTQPLLATYTSDLAQPGCNSTCGNVTIPYPFGFGDAYCFLNEWFQVSCVENKPYLTKYYGQEFGGEVLDVSLVSREISIKANNSRIRVCENKNTRIQVGGDLSGSPFHYDSGNIFTFVGCGNVMLFGNQSGVRYGCTSTCDQNRTVDGCLGINCCQITPSYIGYPENFYAIFTNLVIRNDSCAYVIFGKSGRNPDTFSDPSIDLLSVSHSVALQWRIPPWMYSPPMENNPNCSPDFLYNGSSGSRTILGYNCHCSDCRGGNPYILNGCTDCESRSKKTLILLVFGSTSFGILILGTTCFVLFKSIRKRRRKKLKQKFFKRNGGLLLEQQLSVDETMVDKVSFFTSIELDKATDNFNENRILGRGGQGTVYKGMLVDGKIVAVKKSQLDESNQVDQFINEVVLLSQINHRNVVKLLGCCLETEVPLLVYEFIPNGTLYDLLHNEDDEFLMSWDMRFRIAREVAGALAYLHSATSIPIYHRDVKSSNILLDEKHVAKVSDFGISRHVTIEQTHLTTMVKGTFGYLDPEYFQSNQFTDKSDVYSYGVVLVELLTRQKPISSARNQTEGSFLSLATRFLISMEEDHLNRILDTQILDTTSDNQVLAVAILARRCLSLDGRKRPTMKEVAVELETIRISNMTSAIQTNIQGERSTETELLVISDDTTSSWTTNDTTTPSLEAYPLLSDTF